MNPFNWAMLHWMVWMQMTVRFVYKVILVVIVNMIDLPKLTTLVSTKWSFAYPRRIVFVSW